MGKTPHFSTVSKKKKKFSFFHHPNPPPIRFVIFVTILKETRGVG